MAVTKKRLHVDVSPETHSAVKARSAQEGETLGAWIMDAIARKLDRPSVAPQGRNPLDRIKQKEMRRAAERYIEFLEKCPPEFQDAAMRIQSTVQALYRKTRTRNQAAKKPQDT